MINSKADLKRYLEQDKIALGRGKRKHPKMIGDEIWKFQIILRKTEFYTNSHKSMISKLLWIWYKFRYHIASVRLGISIPLNVFEEGLCIVHYGTIVVNSNAKVGKNCRIQESVTIGSTGGSIKAPKIGSNVYIASGAKIIGDIIIGNNCVIGANAVVTKSFNKDHITIAGIPAKEISDNGSEKFLAI